MLGQTLEIPMSSAQALIVIVLLVASVMGLFACVMRLTILIERWYRKATVATIAQEAATERAAIVVARIMELSQAADKMLLVVVDRSAESAKTDEETLRLLRELVNRDAP